jgi:3-deoxy-7-phosphoheptulonate synthase
MVGTTRSPVAGRALQQPDWPDPGRLRSALDDLAGRPPLVDPVVCHALRQELAFVARGSSFVIQAGECAETFADTTPDRVRVKARQLHEAANLFESLADLPVVRIGRFAGQFAKPRSSPVETLPGGEVLPAYRGDAVNGTAPTGAERRPDPWRMVEASRHSAAALEALFVPNPLSSGLRIGGVGSLLAPTYVSHEALLLDYELALLRPNARDGVDYASSGHLVWVGERTRQPDSAHVALAARVANAVGVKIGPTADPDEVATLVDLLNPGDELGRLSLIVRMGGARVREHLPRVLRGLGVRRARSVVWLCDPMHGNTVRTRFGQKTRSLDSVLDEVTGFFRVLLAGGLYPGGLHLESTPDHVDECVAAADGLDRVLEPYQTACDPRLNPAQVEQVVRHAAALSG